MRLKYDLCGLSGCFYLPFRSIFLVLDNVDSVLLSYHVIIYPDLAKFLNACMQLLCFRHLCNAFVDLDAAKLEEIMPLAGHRRKVQLAVDKLKVPLCTKTK